MTAAHPPSPVARDRQDTILDAAFQAFAAYGVRRASMDDIARGAGMSRSALYLHYRNKEDILRSLTRRFFETAVADMAAALAEPEQSAEQALIAAFRAKDCGMMEAMLATPHGGELLDASIATSAEIVEDGIERMVDVLAGWLEKQGIPAEIGPPAELARTIIVALKGLKSAARDVQDYRAGQLRLARVFARAISRAI